MKTTTIKTTKESLVVRHVGDVYRHAKDPSWRTLNAALTHALRNCIEAGLPFESDDFDTLYATFGGSHWFGANGSGKGRGESLYSIAVHCGHRTACLAFERWAGFQPYLHMGRRLAVAGMPYGSVAGELWWLDRAPEEIIRPVTTASEIDILRTISREPFARRWWVSAIGDTLRLASYYRRGNADGQRIGKPTKLMQLTHEQLDARSRDIRKAIREARPAKPDGKLIIRE